MRAVLCLLLAAGLQAPQAVPPRDTRPPSASVATGRAVIRGRVLAADTGRPLARATVSAGSIGSRPHSATISTDSEGRYELVDLPAGIYEIAATRMGYLDLFYGQRFPRDRRSTLEMGEAAVVDLDFRLPRMSAVSGRITDELGEPIAGVRVAAVLERRAGGRVGGEVRRNITISAGPGYSVITDPAVVTNADGEFRLAGLSPGTYRIVARSSESCACPIPGDPARVVYLSTYFPGAITEAGGTRIRLGHGEEATNINFSLVTGRMATITGAALNSRGVPLQIVTLENSDPLNAAIAGRASVGVDGTFEIPNVSPGSYVLSGAHAGELVRMALEVTGADLSAVFLASRPGWSMTGRVVRDPAAGTSLNLARVVIRSGNEPSSTMRAVLVVSGAALGNASPDGDGRFELSPVFGPTRFHVAVPQGWVVKSMTAGGRNLMGVELDQPPNNDLSDVEIVVTDRVSGVSGIVVDGAGGPTPASAVIVFSEDPNKWWSWTGAVRETRPDLNGTFRIDGLPAGRYALAAVEYVEMDMWLDDAYLRGLLPRAEHVTLEEGEHLTSVSLKLVQ